jgi:hypothetical protein
MIPRVVSPLEQNMYQLVVKKKIYKLHKYYMTLYVPLFSDI